VDPDRLRDVVALPREDVERLRDEVALPRDELPERLRPDAVERLRDDVAFPRVVVRERDVDALPRDELADPRRAELLFERLVVVLPLLAVRVAPLARPFVALLVPDGGT
jgi:hypothetical protein